MPSFRTCIVLVTFVAMLGFSGHARGETARVSPALLESLAKGVNLERVLQQPKDRMPASDEFEKLHSLGLRHIRLPVNPRLILNSQAKTLAKLDAVLDQAREAGLHVTVDLHPDMAWHAKLNADWNEGSVMLRHIWRILASHLAETTAPEDVSLELVNEPTVPAWVLSRILTPLVATVRQAAPQHTIIVGPAFGYHIDGLRYLPAFNDKNIVYAVHFYDPMIFTHQGAFWASKKWLGDLKSVPFPARLTSGTEMARENDELSENSKKQLNNYIRSQFGTAYIDKTLQKASNWARSRGNVPVVINEFGVFKDVAPAADRAMWINHVRSRAEKLGMGWSMWDYATGFGLMRLNPNGAGYVVDRAVANALNLNIKTDNTGE